MLRYQGEKIKLARISVKSLLEKDKKGNKPKGRRPRFTPHRAGCTGPQRGDRGRTRHDRNAAFLLNGTPVCIAAEPATRTLLDWLRENRGLTGTKEGCNEGDCGACTAMVTDGAGSRTLNACILFSPAIDGKAIRTVEGICGPKGEVHPVQAEMVAHHGSQCGF